MVRVLGLDVCRSSVAACLLEELPDKPRRYLEKNAAAIPYLQANPEGIKRLLAMKPDIAVMEPTGVHYSQLWAKTLNDAGVMILWVGHAQLKSHRKELLLPNKNDRADALALSCYALKHLHEPEYFLKFDLFSPGARLRSLSLQLQHLARVQNPVINRLRQNLAHEWPEKAATKTFVTDDAAPLWRFIAGEELYRRSQIHYEKELSETIGTGLSDFSREHASRIVQIQRQELKIVTEIQELAARPEFDFYHRAFDQFAFGDRVRNMILSHIYPLENFLGANGFEIIERVKGYRGKQSKRYRSLNSFKLAVGFGLVEDSSGKSNKWIPGGSKLCRISLWQWVFTRVEPVKGRGEGIRKALGQYIDNLKAGGVPAPLARSRTAAKAMELLFYELIKEYHR